MTIKEMLDALNAAIKQGVLPESDVQVRGGDGATLIRSVDVSPATCTMGPQCVITVGDNFSFGKMT